MLQELIPYVRCIASYPDIEKAVSTFPEVYITAPEGIFKQVKLSNDRYVRLKVNEIPGVKSLTLPDLRVQEELNFLPAGKVPSAFLDQIVEFFRKVMEVKQKDYEAHAWILWTKEDGYFISIPPQVVSKASVKFEYSPEALPTGAVIVVDIHSHNTMNAFFSGTDNANDRMGIYYSGVIGKLTRDSYEYTFRFNLQEDKRTCTLDDIFIQPEAPKVDVPQQWLDQVQVPKVPVMAGNFGKNKSGKWTNSLGGPAVPFRPDSKGPTYTYGSIPHQMALIEAAPASTTIWSVDENMYIKNGPDVWQFIRAKDPLSKDIPPQEEQVLTNREIYLMCEDVSIMTLEKTLRLATEVETVIPDSRLLRVIEAMRLGTTIKTSVGSYTKVASNLWNPDTKQGISYSDHGILLNTTQENIQEAHTAGLKTPFIPSTQEDIKKFSSEAAAREEALTMQQKKLSEEEKSLLEQERDLDFQFMSYQQIPGDCLMPVDLYVPGPLDEEERNDPVGGSTEFEYYVEKYGMKVADAWDSAITELTDLESCEEALLDIIRASYNFLGETGRNDLATNGF